MNRLYKILVPVLLITLLLSACGTKKAAQQARVSATPAEAGAASATTGADATKTDASATPLPAEASATAETQVLNPETTPEAPANPNELFPTETPFPTLAPEAAVTKPTIAARFPISEDTLGGSKLLIVGNTVWVGLVNGSVIVRSATDGAELKTIALAVIPDAAPGADGVLDMTYDGQRVWALVSNSAEGTTEVVVVNAADFGIVNRLDLSELSPLFVEAAAGEVWAGGPSGWVVFNKATQQQVAKGDDSVELGMTYDGKGMIWAPFSGDEVNALGFTVGGDHAVVEHKGCELLEVLYPTASRMLALGYPPCDQDQYYDSSKYGQVVPVALLSYPFDNMDAAPTLITILNDQYQATASGIDVISGPMAADSKYLYILGIADSKLHQHDLQTGQAISELDLLDQPAIDSGRMVMDLGYDGKSLWVLTDFDLVHVVLPK